MNKFNLTFSGEILAGFEPEQVKLHFAKMFAIDDPEQLERVFSGDPVVLRRSLDRKDAGQYFQDLQKLGMVSELVTIPGSDPATDNAQTAPSTSKKRSSTSASKNTAAQEVLVQPQLDITQQNQSADSSEPARKPEPKPERPAIATQNPATPVKPEPPVADVEATTTDQKSDSPGSTPRKKARKKKTPSANTATNNRPAQRSSELTDNQRLEAREAANQQAARAEAKRKTAEEAAVRKAQREHDKIERARLKAVKAAKAEEAARLKAERDELKRLKAEEAARLKAERDELKRLKAEETARLKAERDELKRLKAEASARLKAERDELRRLKAKEVAERKAQRELEKAQRELEKAERARLKAEKAAKAAHAKEQKEESRRLAEAAATHQEPAATQKKPVATYKEPAAQQEPTARQKEELEERKQPEAKKVAQQHAEGGKQGSLKAKEAARQQAKAEQQKRLEAKEDARRQAEREGLKHLEAAEAAQIQEELDKIRAREKAEAAQLQAELEEKKQRAAAEAAKIKAAAQHKEKEAQRNSAARKQAALKTLRKREKSQARAQQAKHRTSSGHGQQTTPRSIKARVKTNLEVPKRISRQKLGPDAPIVRRRQPGEPNLYTTRPFRNSPEIRARSQEAHKRMHRALTVGSLALATLLVLVGILLRLSPDPLITSARGVAIDSHARPILLAGDSLLFHDRAGVGTETLPLSALGVSALAPPLHFDSSGRLIALGHLAENSAQQSDDDPMQLVRCEIAPGKCQLFPAALEDIVVDTFVINPSNDDLLLGDTTASQLIKINSAGKLLSRAPIAMPDNPVLRLDSGLLLINSAQGPAISVFRYDDNDFGKQLDEILLMPAPAVKAEQTVAGDFVWSGDAWWASLYNPETGNAGLYRFDSQWNYLNEVKLPRHSGKLQLIPWGKKTLVNDQRHISLHRFNSQGVIEAPMASTLLQDLVASDQRDARISTVAWRIVLLLCALTAVAGLSYGYLQSLRALVYKAVRERGAESVDDYADTLQWIEPVPNRKALLRRLSISYGVLVVGIMSLAIGQNVSALQLTALLIALSGPAIALLLLSRRPVGHIGVVEDKMLLVDHRGVYHLGRGSAIQYGDTFLLLDDVVMFTGNPLLPAFSPEKIQRLIHPLARNGIRVDRATILVKLLEARHPLAQGVLAIGATAAIAILLLLAQGIF